MSEVRHVLGISGGKDSAALALYLNKLYGSKLPIEYYFCDTGKELPETYRVVQALERELGGGLFKLEAAFNSHKDPFDHFLGLYGGYLPSSTSRWCTRNLKLKPFEDFVGDQPTISYVGIREDENRDGYISKKSNIQSIFPFRRNIWSEDVISKVLANAKRDEILEYYSVYSSQEKIQEIQKVVETPLSIHFNQTRKLESLINLGIREFNHVVFKWLKTTDYPMALVDHFPLIDNEDHLVREDIFSILRNSSVGVPQYYEKREFEVDGQKGYYARSRSGCFFCFFQQKIEWVWLFENHPDLFSKAMEYEKDGYSWMDNETLEELINPKRIKEIKIAAIKKSQEMQSIKSDFLLDNIDEAEGIGCAACFI